jgi:hypothetical protein
MSSDSFPDKIDIVLKEHLITIIITRDSLEGRGDSFMFVRLPVKSRFREIWHQTELSMAEKRVMDRNDKGMPLGVLSPCEREIAAIRFKVPDSGNGRMAHIHETLVESSASPSPDSVEASGSRKTS